MKVQEDPYPETVVKLCEEEAKALEFIVCQNKQIDSNIANISSSDLLKVALDFYLTYSKYILFKVRDMKINDFTDHRFISASLMMGMWSSMRQGPEFDDFKAIDSNYGERFLAISKNIFALLKQERIEKLIPNLLIDCVSEETSEDLKALYLTLFNDLRELSITSAGILGRLDLPQVAIVFLD